ncbi:Glycoside hydrolase family 57 [uncultured delta proteobacterium]|uniref:Glycoside hydrolase family 57 n=1 Tax=uncultured delta proteobacterium TaxID=34034 RepID=A0A212KBV6_9DELT|nr:Glycoside hydrolase family 57 [uncultured delta proteobacterium]
MPSLSRQFCIHGHFYQPPREDPWLGRILIEPSAAPMRHWNERIVAESYGPIGWAHRIGDGGKIVEICNCYEWMSFNVGPTLLHWLERNEPAIYGRILQADAASLERWGHGNAIAQVYHHVIMPLASPLDKELEVAWAVADFEKRFGRKPEGMWLAESAADDASLQALADAGIAFVILSPHQAKAIAGPDGELTPVSGGNFDVTRPYRVKLSSGASMAVFFYHGVLSQAVAFDRLLENGENFWNRVNGGATGGLLTLATDGETYGHHFRFGEMALAYLLAQGRAGRDGLGLTNPGAYLAATPPAWSAVLIEPSSWSCAHGVERWRSNCGCTTGGHPDWNQKWRGPLRKALADAKTDLDAHFFAAGKACFKDPRAALVAYGRVLADGSAGEAFAKEHFTGGEAAANTAWKLLTMQEQAVASFASCAWFFDDISRIEPVNGMTFMWRAMELSLQTGGPDLRDAFRDTLAQADSNKPEEGSGATILRKRVMPRQQDAAALCLLALALLDIEGGLPAKGEETTFAWPAFAVTLSVESAQDGDVRVISGTARLGTPLEKGGDALVWTWHAPRIDRLPTGAFDAGSITVTLPDGSHVTRNFGEMPRHTRDYVALQFVEAVKKRGAEQAATMARHVLCLTGNWEEAQTSMPYAWDWAAFAPHLLAACVLDVSAADAKRAQVLAFCRDMQIPPLMYEQAARMVQAAMLRALAGEKPDWPRLTGWAVRVKQYLPQANLWPVQNAFWQLHSDDQGKRILGEALGFA